MYRKKDKSKQTQMQMVCIEDLVPREHLLREIESAMDWTFIYDEVKGLYKEAEWGNPGIDPVVLFKIVFVQYLYGIRSMRQTIREIEVNVAYRWFIGYDLTEDIPHFSTFGKNYKRRFEGTDIFERIFGHILEEAVRCGFVEASAIFIDGTHIRANANKKKYVKEVVAVEAKRYQRELDEEINRDREEHGKKPLKDRKDDDDGENHGGGGAAGGVGSKEVVKSTTDPDCGMYHKGEHEKQMAYVAGVACDHRNFVLGFSIASGNTHDSVMFDDVYGKTVARFPEVRAVVADSAYRTPWIAKQLLDDGRVPCLPYKSPMTPDGYFRKYEYVYDEYYDCVLCPNNRVLTYSTTNREGYREYKSDPGICKSCPNRERCTKSKDCQKTVTRHVWEAYMEQVEDYRHTPWVKGLYDKRKQRIERVFADANFSLSKNARQGRAKLRYCV